MSRSTYQKNISNNNGSRSIVKQVTSQAMRLFLSASMLCLIVGATSVFSQTVPGSPCVRANPTVLAGPSFQSTFPGNQLTFMVSVTNNDSPGCSPSTFKVMPTFAEEGFKHTPDCIRFTLGPGESGTRKITITAPAATCIGPKSFRETAINESVPGISAFGEAGFNIVPLAPDCGRAAPTVTIIPPNQEAPAGEQLVYRVTVTNNDNPLCGGSDFIASPTLPGGLTSQTPKDFRLFVPAGGSNFRDVILRSDLFASGDLLFKENVTHTCATCLTGNATGIFSIPSVVFSTDGIDLTLVQPTDPNGPFPLCNRNAAGQLILTVKNQGGTFAPAFITEVQFIADGAFPGMQVTIPSPGLLPGASRDLSPINIPAGCANPECVFVVFIDPSHGIAEDDRARANNGGVGKCPR
jgi:hypothetical protein